MIGYETKSKKAERLPVLVDKQKQNVISDEDKQELDKLVDKLIQERLMNKAIYEALEFMKSPACSVEHTMKKLKELHFSYWQCMIKREIKL